MKHRYQPGPMVSDPADAKKVFKMLKGPQSHQEAGQSHPGLSGAIRIAHAAG